MIEWPAVVLDLLPRVDLPEPGAPLNCAVSGGPDSAALVVLAVAHGCRVTAHHVDHGLRPGSDREAGVVAALAARLGADFRAVTIEVADGPNLEARARSARYAVLPADVATGHTMDDQAETVLLQLLRGAATDGLAGMRSGPRHPLLAVRRRETRAVCAAMDLNVVDDPSNRDPRHLRNRVRHELLPLCSGLAGRDVVPVLARQARLLAEEADLLDSESLAAVPDPTDARALAAAPVPLARRAVRRWLRGAGATASSGSRQGIDGRHPPSSAEVARVLSVAAGRATATELAGGSRVRRSHGRLFLDPRPSADRPGWAAPPGAG